MAESPNPSDGPISHTQSVTQWLEDLKQGDSLAAQKIWDRYLDRLIRVAEKRLGRIRRSIGDEEDVVLVAYGQFLKRLEEQGFSDLQDRDDLWQILVMLTDRRAIDQARREMAVTRGGARMAGQSAIQADQYPTADGIEQLSAKEPTPEFAYMLAEELEQRLASLGKDVLRNVALLRMFGNSNQEVARELRISLRSVERKLSLIREIWTREGECE